ncbi:acetyltransferase [Meredithblackwellia eburnea MCA 4105]
MGELNLSSHTAPMLLLPSTYTSHIPQLASLLTHCVQKGSSVNFMLPFTEPEAEEYWKQFEQEVQDEKRFLWAVKGGDEVVGCVMLVPVWQPNGKHRADVGKLLVREDWRRRGIARDLMNALELKAKELGRTTLVLDTDTDSPAAKLYPALGWTELGTIPNFHTRPEGGPLAPATWFYKLLA